MAQLALALAGIREQAGLKQSTFGIRIGERVRGEGGKYADSTVGNWEQAESPAIPSEDIIRAWIDIAAEEAEAQERTEAALDIRSQLDKLLELWRVATATRPPRPPRRSDRPVATTIAVLPFECDQAALPRLRPVLDGFRNHVVSELWRLPGAVVTTPEHVPEGVRGRGRRFVLSGAAAEVAGSHLSLSLRLTIGTESAVVWAESFLVSGPELVEAYTAIPSSVAAAIGSQLQPKHVRTRTRVGPKPETYDAFLRALHLIETNEQPDLLTAVALLRQVVEETPDFADGHAVYGLALWRTYFAAWGLAGVESLEGALAEAQRALELDRQSAWARMALVRVYWDLGRHEAAIAEGVGAVQDAPGSLEAQLALARALNNAGLAEEALPITEQVLRRSPENLTARKLLVWNLLMSGSTDQACEHGETHARHHPSDGNTAWATTMALALSGHTRRAADVAERSLRAEPSSAPLWVLLGYVLQCDGQDNDAVSVWRRGVRMVRLTIGRNSRNLRALASIGNMLAAAGDVEEAVCIAATIYDDEPFNSYLLYRISHIYAAANDAPAAIRVLSEAVSAGFLSVQMMRCEEKVGALKILSGADAYRNIVTELERRNDVVKAKYAPIVGELLKR